MDKLKELVRQSWSRWYVRAALVACLIAFVGMPQLASREVIDEWKTTTEIQLAEQNLRHETGRELDASGNVKMREAEVLIRRQMELTNWQLILSSGLLVG
jgi:hypothetical protein